MTVKIYFSCIYLNILKFSLKKLQKSAFVENFKPFVTNEGTVQKFSHFLNELSATIGNISTVPIIEYQKRSFFQPTLSP